MEGAQAWFDAILARDVERIMLLVDRWARSRTEKGETGLMLAVRARSFDVAQILLPHEAGLLAPNGNTSLVIAIHINAPELCDLLFREEGNIALPNGSTPLRLAMDLNMIRCVEALAPYYDDRRDEHGLTHLDYAVFDKNPETVRILCESGKYSEDTILEALDFAQKDNSPDVVDVLKSWLNKSQAPNVILAHHFVPTPSPSYSAQSRPLRFPSNASTSMTTPTFMQVRTPGQRPKSAVASKHDTQLIISSASPIAQSLARVRTTNYTYKEQLRKAEEKYSKLAKKYAASVERSAFLELLCVKQQEYISSLSTELAMFRNAIYNITTERLEYLNKHPAHKKTDREYVLGTKVYRPRSSQAEAQESNAPNINIAFSSTMIRDLLASTNDSCSTEEMLARHSTGLTALHSYIQKTMSCDKTIMDDCLRDIMSYIDMYEEPRADLKAAFLNAFSHPAKHISSATVRSSTSGGLKGTVVHTKGSKKFSLDYEKYRLYNSGDYRRIGSGPFRIPDSPSIKKSAERSSSLPSATLREPIITKDDFSNISTSPQSKVISPSVIRTRNYNVHTSNSETASYHLSSPPTPVSQNISTQTSPSVDITNTMASSKIAQLDEIAYYVVDHMPTPGQHTLGAEAALTELMKAACSNDLQGCLKYFREQAGKQTESGATALMIAAERGYTDCVRVLRRTEVGLELSGLAYATAPSTALMFSALNGHLACAQLILETEERVSDERGWSALMCATCLGNTAMMSLLLPSQAGVVTTDKFKFGAGFSALSIAILLDNIGTVSILIENEREQAALRCCKFAPMDLARSKAMKAYLQHSI